MILALKGRPTCDPPVHCLCLVALPSVSWAIAPFQGWCGTSFAPRAALRLPWADLGSPLRGSATQLLRRQIELARAVDGPVKFPRVERHIHRKRLAVAGQFQVRWYSPRVPTGATSPKGHRTAGDLFACGVRDGHLRREGRVHGHVPRLAVRAHVRPFSDLLLRVVESGAAMQLSAGSTRRARKLISAPRRNT